MCTTAETSSHIGEATTMNERELASDFAIITGAARG
ncbi:MAG: hypothetical protein ACI8W3_003802, partial [Myxococcota bacterium]